MKVRDNASQEWIEILAVKGDKGDKGDPGPQGPAGPQGPPGPSGGGGSGSGGGDTVRLNEFRIEASAHKGTNGNNDLFFPVTVKPNTTYVFEGAPYTWCGVQTAAGMIGHTANTDQTLQFTTGANETQVTIQLYPGANSTTIATFDASPVKLYAIGQGIVVNTTFTQQGINLGNGTLYNSDTRIVTDYIQVIEGDVIKFSSTGIVRQVSGCLFDSNRQFVQNFPADAWVNLGTFTAPASGYIRVAFSTGGFPGDPLNPTDDGSTMRIEIQRGDVPRDWLVDTQLIKNSQNLITNGAVATAYNQIADGMNNVINTLNGFLNPTKYAMPCASGYSNFSSGSVYWKTPDNMVHLTAIITIGQTTNPNANLFNMPTGYRPAATVVIPATTSYESNYMPQAAGINFNSDGTCRYYGPQLGTNNHLMINAEYPAAATSAQAED